MEDQEFDRIQKQVFDALPDIASAYDAAGRQPRADTVIALADLFDCSPNELRKVIAGLQNSN